MEVEFFNLGTQEVLILVLIAALLVAVVYAVVRHSGGDRKDGEHD
jgi:hypothetical protein